MNVDLNHESFERYNHIACVDEVGRGCLFGDVVAAAVILPKDIIIEGVKDSKKLSAKKRAYLDGEIREAAIAIGIGIVNNKIIDEINIKQATRLAMKLSILDLKDKAGNKVAPDIVLIDAESIDLAIEQRSIIGGDNLIHGISAASIIAKVYRDSLCDIWDTLYSGYDLKSNKGYGTKKHIASILELGATDKHRMSFLKKIK